MLFTVSGKITSISCQPLSEATRSLIDFNTGSIANQDEAIEIKNLCRHKYKIEIKYLGYQTKVVALKIEKSIILEFTLMKGGINWKK